MLRFALVGFLLALAACGQASKKEFIVTGPDEKNIGFLLPRPRQKPMQFDSLQKLSTE